MKKKHKSRRGGTDPDPLSHRPGVGLPDAIIRDCPALWNLIERGLQAILSPKEQQKDAAAQFSKKGRNAKIRPAHESSRQIQEQPRDECRRRRINQESFIDSGIIGSRKNDKTERKRQHPACSPWRE